MLKIKYVQGKDLQTLENNVNAFLASLTSEVIDIKTEEGMVVILYKEKESWEGRLCCDCQYWDDGGEMTTSGLCHECGQRRRFNNKSCDRFKDVREAR